MNIAEDDEGTLTTADKRIAKRASLRLNARLDEEGYPIDLHGRSSTLAKAIGVSQQEAAFLLSGVVPWSWDLLDKVCATFAVRPGHLLDESLSAVLPSDTLPVPSAAGGETIAWRTPSGLGSHRLSRQSKLLYVTSQRGEQILLHIFELQPPPPHETTPGQTYAVESDMGYRIGTLQDDGNDAMKFVDFSDGSYFTVPHSPSEDARMKLAGPVIVTAVIQ